MKGAGKVAMRAPLSRELQRCWRQVPDPPYEALSRDASAFAFIEENSEGLASFHFGAAMNSWAAIVFTKNAVC